MKLTHVLGHRSKWNIDLYNEQKLGDYFLITAYSHGSHFENNKISPILDKAMIDLQFYGKKGTLSDSGKLAEFPFHPVHANPDQVTNVYFRSCIIEAVKYQENKGFRNIIIPHFYENENEKDIIDTIRNTNQYLKKHRKNDHQYFMTLPFAHEIIRDADKVEAILLACTDMEIIFDGYFIACENKPKYGQKLTIDYDLITNLSKVFKVLKTQDFKTIYAYANFDAIIYLAQTDIDYITIGSYENLRKFELKRFTEIQSGGPSDGHYFSEKLLNVVRAGDLAPLRSNNLLGEIRNENNIFSDVILDRGFKWNTHRAEIHKNYLISIGQLLKKISDIKDLPSRKEYVLDRIDRAIAIYGGLIDNNIFLTGEGENYHLNLWKTYLRNVR